MNGHPMFHQLLDEMRALHEKKTQDYGQAKEPLANLRASAEVGVEPWRATWLRAKDKVQRINAYCINGRLANEGVEDSFMDLAAYCLLAIILHREWVAEKQRETELQELKDPKVVEARKAGYDGRPCTHCGSLKTVGSVSVAGSGWHTYVCDDCKHTWVGLSKN